MLIASPGVFRSRVSRSFIERSWSHSLLSGGAKREVALLRIEFTDQSGGNLERLILYPTCFWVRETRAQCVSVQ